MPKKRSADAVTLQDILEAVNNGFTRMQEQTDARFDAQDARFDAIQATQQEHSQQFEEAAGERAAISRKLDSEIAERDRQEATLRDHDQRIKVLEAKSV